MDIRASFSSGLGVDRKLTLAGTCSAAEIDSWVSHLSQCKQLTEAEVKRLCDKVRRALFVCQVTSR